MKMMRAETQMHTQTFTRRMASPGDLLRLLLTIFRASPDLRAQAGDTPIDRAFLERVMLAVSQVNQCRYCLYGHTRAAFHAGVPRDEITRLLEGELGTSPPAQAVALLYAQHYAETNGHPEPGAVERLQAEYGQAGAARLQAAIYMITLGNLLGNTFDGLISRLRGRPATKGNLLSSLYMITLGNLLVAHHSMA